MRFLNSWKLLLIVVFFIAFLEFYTFQAVKTIFRRKDIAFIVLGISMLFYIVLFYIIFNTGRSAEDKHKIFFITTAIFINFIPKIVLSIPLLLEDIVRLIEYIFRLSSDHEGTIAFPSRRRFVSIMAMGLASIPFLGILYGVIKGRFDYSVKNIKVTLPGLPEAFKGYKIVQISDIHSGSFSEKNIPEIQKGVDLINEQNADLVVFTGDLVNSVADEIIPYKSTFAQIQSKDGKYSVLGNHDYGNYAYRGDEVKNEENREEITRHLADMGFTQLRNQYVVVEKKGAKINLIGVENWGSSNYFPKTGDLDKATKGMNPEHINILMSHDPSHFDHDLPSPTNVINYPIPIHLTLSGHTHGMQFGVEIPGIIKWSPVEYRYPNWAGLYKDKDKYLYVNRGFGYIGFPGRVGIRPEITVLELV